MYKLSQLCRRDSLILLKHCGFYRINYKNAYFGQLLIMENESDKTLTGNSFFLYKVATPSL